MATNQRVLTADEKEYAEAIGKTEAEMLAVIAEGELQPGTYSFNIASGKVEVSQGDNMMKGAIQANVRLVPLDMNGAPCKRYGSIFVRVTVPVDNDEYVPNSTTISVGSSQLKWLSAAAGSSMGKLVKAFKALDFPVELLNKKIKGNYTLRADKNDATKFWPDVKPAKADAKTSPLKADGAKAADGPAKTAVGDTELPF